MSTLTPKGLAAVEQFAARWVFDDQAPAEMQRELVRHIEAAILEFKSSSQLQDLIARTLRRAMKDRIIAAMDGWHRSNDSPQETEEAPQ